eukprot:SAG11_NODE_3214_length_2606_cov_2.788193_1_plen_71_part_00
MHAQHHWQVEKIYRYRYLPDTWIQLYVYMSRVDLLHLVAVDLSNGKYLYMSYIRILVAVDLYIGSNRQNF